MRKSQLFAVFFALIIPFALDITLPRSEAAATKISMNAGYCRSMGGTVITLEGGGWACCYNYLNCGYNVCWRCNGDSCERDCDSVTCSPSQERICENDFLDRLALVAKSLEDQSKGKSCRSCASLLQRVETHMKNRPGALTRPQQMQQFQRKTQQLERELQTQINQLEKTPPATRQPKPTTDTPKKKTPVQPNTQVK